MRFQLPPPPSFNFLRLLRSSPRGFRLRRRAASASRTAGCAGVAVGLAMWLTGCSGRCCPTRASFVAYGLRGSRHSLTLGAMARAWQYTCGHRFSFSAAKLLFGTHAAGRPAAMHNSSKRSRADDAGSRDLAALGHLCLRSYCKHFVAGVMVGSAFIPPPP